MYPGIYIYKSYYTISFEHFNVRVLPGTLSVEAPFDELSD